MAIGLEVVVVCKEAGGLVEKACMHGDPRSSLARTDGGTKGGGRLGYVEHTQGRRPRRSEREEKEGNPRPSEWLEWDSTIAILHSMITLQNPNARGGGIFIEVM